MSHTPAVSDRVDGAGGVVVVGAGQAGAAVALGLRRRGFAGPVTLVGAEREPPYERPPLSKAFLAGEAAEDVLHLQPSLAAYDEQDVAVLLGERVERVDRAAGVVQTSAGRVLSYDHLVLAVGARPRRLPVPGADLDGVVVLRTLADSRDLRRRLADAQHAVVVGAGFVGMEVAAVAAAAGRPVTVLEALDRPHARLVTPAVSSAVAAEHLRRGTRLEFGAGVTGLLGNAAGQVRAVALDDGRQVTADLVLVAVGVTPRSELAQEAGLEVLAGPPGGIVVDVHLRTSDPHISALGDCAAFPLGALGGRRSRVESVQNAVDQAATVSARLTGAPSPYTAVPWFWSDQFDLHLQVAGLGEEHDDTVLLGDSTTGSFSVLCFRGGLLVSVESVSRPADHLAARKLLSAGAVVDLATASAVDFDLRRHLTALRRRVR